MSNNSTNTSNPYLFAMSNQSNFSSINGLNLGITSDSTPKSLVVKGDIELDGELIIKNNPSLNERLDTIEKLLCIPTRNLDLEEKYPELRRLYEQYMLEVEKYTMWEKLKGNNDE